MAAKNQSPMDFIVAALEKNKDAAYADVRAAAEKKGLTIYPIMYGRAKAMLGLVPVAKRGTGKYARKTKAARARATAPTDGTIVVKRRGRPRKSTTTSTSLDSLQGLVAHVQQAEREREKMQRALQKIREVLASA